MKTAAVPFVLWLVATAHGQDKFERRKYQSPPRFDREVEERSAYIDQDDHFNYDDNYEEDDPMDDALALPSIQRHTVKDRDWIIPRKDNQQTGHRPPQNSKYPTVDCRTKFRTFPHEKFCDLYYSVSSCSDDVNLKDSVDLRQAIVLSCPNGLLHRPSGGFGLIRECDYPHNVDCTGRTRHNRPDSTEHCDWLYGIFGHETSCTRYWTCWNGTATEQYCGGGLLYNEGSHSCDWPENVPGCQKHPLCKDDANGNVALGKSCNRYWACQGGYPRLQRCPAMLVFDKDRRRCVAPPTKDCDVPPQPKADIDNPQEFQVSDDLHSNNNRRNRNKQTSSDELTFNLPEDSSNGRNG